MNSTLAIKSTKQTIYRPTEHVGIRTIWVWNKLKNDYVRKTSGNRFEAYIKINGKSLHHGTKTLEEAKKWRSLKEVMGLQGAPMEAIGFEELRTLFLEHKKGAIMQSTYESYISLGLHLKYFDTLNVLNINAKTIDSWLRHLKSESYRKNLRETRLSFKHEVTLLKGIFNHYVQYIDERYRNPIQERHFEDCIVNRRKLQLKEDENRNKYMNAEELNRVLSTLKSLIDSKGKGHLQYVLALVQLRSGLRVGEAAALKVEDINFQSGKVKIRNNVFWSRERKHIDITDLPKNGKSRDVFLTADALNEIRNLTQDQKRSGLIFSENGTQPVTYRSIQYRYDKAFKLAGVRWRSTHICRHTFATDFIRLVKNPLPLQGLLGHSKISQTQHYAKLVEETIQDGFNEYKKKLAE